MPMTLSGRLVAAASFVIEIDDVFEARIASAGVIWSNDLKTSVLIARFSTTASITNAASLKLARSVVVRIRPWTCCFSSTVNLSFRYSEGDYVRALRAHYASKLRLRLDLVILAVAGLTGVYLWRLPDSRWLSIAALSVTGIFGLMLLAAFIVIPPHGGQC